MDYLQIVLGLGLLYAGGEGLVRGASALGRAIGLSPMIIGLTVVSLGTSSPELAASLAGVFKGAPAVSFGNVIGSNIANLGLVLGITVLIWPLAVAARFIRRDMPFLLAISALMFGLVWNGWINRFEGFLLLIIHMAYLWFLLRRDSEPEQVTEEFAHEFGRQGLTVPTSVLAILAGVGLLVLGAHLLIQSAVAVARDLGVSERVIGLTMVALGTSLPELASCFVAAIRREGDIVLGNLLGSNIFNILFILGLTAIARPVAVETEAVWLDLAVMLAVTLVVGLFLVTGMRLTRWEGGLLTLGYAAYAIYLFV